MLQKFEPGRGYTKADWDAVSELDEIELTPEQMAAARPFSDLTRTVYHLHLIPDDNGTFLVTCVELPEVTTFGENEADCLRQGRAAIAEALAARAAYSAMADVVIAAE